MDDPVVEPLAEEPPIGGERARASFGMRLSRAIVLAASLATVVLSLLTGRIERFRDGFTDEMIYRLLARNLIDHHFYGYSPGHSVAYRPPGYPAFDALIRILNDSQTSVRIAQALLAGATVWLAAWIAKRLFGDVAAAITAVFVLVVGTIVVYASFELSETLATATLVAAIAATLMAVDKRSWRWAASSGLLLAVSAYTRPQGLFLVAPLAVWAGLAVGPAPWKLRIIVGGAIVAALVAAILPWTIRNEVRIHAFVPISAYGGEALFLANNPKANGYFVRTNIVAPIDYPRIRALPEGKQESEWFRLAMNFITAHPGKAIHNWLHDGRLFVTLRDELIGRNLLLRGTYRPPIADDRWLWPLAGIGMILAAIRRGRVLSLLPALVVVYYLAFFMVFLPLPRFRHGVVPFLAVYAGGALAIAGSWFVGRIRGAASTKRQIVGTGATV